MLIGPKTFPLLRDIPFKTRQPARIIHFGRDECHRLMVLRSAGYAVEDCDSVRQLRACLAGERAVDAVAVSEGEGVTPEDAVQVARRHSSVPVILFRNGTRTCEEAGFDLVVESLTRPEVWLNEVNTLIGKRRGIPTRANETRQDRAGLNPVLH